MAHKTVTNLLAPRRVDTRALSPCQAPQRSSRCLDQNISRQRVSAAAQQANQTQQAWQPNFSPQLIKLVGGGVEKTVPGPLVNEGGKLLSKRGRNLRSVKLQLRLTMVCHKSSHGAGLSSLYCLYEVVVLPAARL